jgi:hypothetical protein
MAGTELEPKAVKASQQKTEPSKPRIICYRMRNSYRDALEESPEVWKRRVESDARVAVIESIDKLSRSAL